MDDLKTNLVIDGGVMYEQHSQDTTAIIEANKRAYNDSDKYFKGDLHHVARVPEIFVYEFMKEFKCSYQQLMRDPAMKRKLIAKLNSNDYRFLRVKPGRI